MHITLYKPGDTPIPPKLYGGTERVDLLARQDAGGNRPPSDAHRQRPKPYSRRGTSRVAGRKQDPPAWLRAVVPGHDGHRASLGHAEVKKPFFVPSEATAGPDEKLPANTVFVSQSHAANHGSRHFVQNGLDPEKYACSEKREDYAVFLAKARWQAKNLRGATAVARRAGVELRVLGSRNWPLNLQRLLPAIRGVRYYGMVAEDGKTGSAVAGALPDFSRALARAVRHGASSRRWPAALSWPARRMARCRKSSRRKPAP